MDLLVIIVSVLLVLKTSDKERFAYAVLAADELVAVSNTVKFRYDDRDVPGIPNGKTYLNWAVGNNVDNAVWISLFLVIVVTINVLPVKVGINKSVIQLAAILMKPNCRSSANLNIFLAPSNSPSYLCSL